MISVLDAMVRKVLAVVIAIVVAGASVVVYKNAHRNSSVIGPPCRTTTPLGTFSLTLAQAANATTIAAVGKRLGVADHGVTIALAAAMQESKLQNLSGGDRDSLGLFQQRPSEGWGTREQISSPVYAATAFYSRLVKVTGWQALSVTAAAQAVQHSAAPDAYSQWESEARAFAAAFTGEFPAAFACRATTVKEGVSGGLTSAATAELGSQAFGVTVDTSRGWLVASWLIGHAGNYNVSSVTFAGKHWSASSGQWSDSTSSAAVVSFA